LIGAMPNLPAVPSGFIRPDWPAPPNVFAFVSARDAPGVSAPPFDACNLGDHVDDAADAVRSNRRLLREALHLPAEPLWLRQVHGIEVCDADALGPHSDRLNIIADASLTRRPGEVLAVLTADCLPILLCADDGSEVAAVHAGWRGLAAGAIEATVRRMHTPASRLLAWLGPAIGPDAFEVGSEVRSAFVRQDTAAAAAFRPIAAAGADEKWLCNLPLLTKMRLRSLGLSRIGGGDLCTVSDPARFFSHRRDRRTGRMASLIWKDPGV
jgi:polyphenol oxidase